MDENSKLGGDGGAPRPTGENAVLENPNSATDIGDEEGAGDALVGAAESNPWRTSRQPSSRTPFSNLSQEEADLALARTLQEQERAYMMLRMNGSGSNNGSWEDGNYYHDDGYVDQHGNEYDGIDNEEEDDHADDDGNDGYDLDDDYVDEDDAFDVHAHADSGQNDAPIAELDPTTFPDDESYARALQDVEEREMAARLLAVAGISETGEDDDLADHGGNSEAAWGEVDPDELSYEELIALGEVVGTESRGLSADTIASLPSTTYKSTSIQDRQCGTCVICRVEYEDGDTLTALACKHSYHSDCINNWLKINKVCPVCSTEVSTSG